MPAVSVIVPIYNSEEYLAQSLDSLAAQTLKNIEVICINDGSTDSSLAIMQDYASRYPQFKVIDKPNSGYGAALNTGIDAATGEYISILESDDFVDGRMYESLYALTSLDAFPACDITEGAHEMLDTLPGGAPRAPDIVKSSYYNYWDASEIEPAICKLPQKDEELPNRITAGTLSDMPALVKDHPSIWACLYRRQFLNENNLRFVEAPGAGWVDNPWLFATMLTAKVVVWDPRQHYYYRRTNEDASVFLKDYRIPLDRIENVLDILDEHAPVDEQILLLFTRRAMMYITSIINAMDFDEYEPRLYEQVRRICSRLNPDLVAKNTGIYASHKGFFRELLGLHLADIAPHEPVDSPEVTVLVPTHNDCLYVCGVLESINQQPYEDLHVIVQDEGGSTDCTGMLVQQIASIDQRITYQTQPGAIALSSVSTEYVLVIDAHSEIKKNMLPEMVQHANQTQADLVVFGKFDQWFCPTGTVSPSDISSHLLQLMPDTFGGICVRTELLRSVFAGISDSPFATCGPELMLQVFCSASSISFCPLSCHKPLSRSLSHPSVRRKHEDPDPEKLNMGMLTRMEQTLRGTDIYEQAQPSFAHYAAALIAQDLRNAKEYRDLRSVTALANSTYVPKLVGPLDHNGTYTHSTPEDLLFDLAFDEAQYHRKAGGIRVKEARERGDRFKLQRDNAREKLAERKAQLNQSRKKANEYKEQRDEAREEAMQYKKQRDDARKEAIQFKKQRDDARERIEEFKRNPAAYVINRKLRKHK